VVRSRFLVPWLVVVLLALLVASSALGLVVFQPGRYKGTTEQGLPITFKATRGQIRTLRVTTVAICESGKGSKGTFLVRHTPIRHARFEFKGIGNNGATHVKIRGRLAGPYAGGTIVDRTEVNPENEGQPEPGGTDHCKVQEHWAAEIP
jgi:hypothetical protein